MIESRSSTPGVTSSPPQINNEDEDDENEDDLTKIRKRVHISSNEFHDLALNIVIALQSHPDLDVRFLAVRLGFNQFYRKMK